MNLIEPSQWVRDWGLLIAFLHLRRHRCQDAISLAPGSQLEVGCAWASLWLWRLGSFSAHFRVLFLGLKLGEVWGRSQWLDENISKFYLNSGLLTQLKTRRKIGSRMEWSRISQPWCCRHWGPDNSSWWGLSCVLKMFGSVPALHLLHAKGVLTPIWQ